MQSVVIEAKAFTGPGKHGTAIDYRDKLTPG